MPRNSIQGSDDNVYLNDNGTTVTFLSEVTGLFYKQMTFVYPSQEGWDFIPVSIFVQCSH